MSIFAAININPSFFKALDQILINFNQLQDQNQKSINQLSKTASGVYKVSSDIQIEILPKIKHQLTSISILIKPLDLLQSNLNQFQDFLNLFNQFHDQIQSIFNLIQLSNQILLNQNHPNLISIGKTKFKEIYNLIDHLITISIQITNVYQTYFTNLQDFNQIETNRNLVLQKTSQSWQLIDQIIQCFNQSDLEFLQMKAKSSVEMIEDALEEVRTILIQTDHSTRLEDRLDRLDLNPQQELEEQEESGSEEFEMFLESGEHQVSLTEIERSRVNLLIPIIRLSRLLGLRLVNPTQSNSKLLNSIKLEEIEKIIDLIEKFPVHIDELVSELDTSPHSKVSISKTLDELFLDCNQLISSLKTDGIESDLKELKWFEIWTNQMKNASSSLLQEFD